ncbi:TetR/AcrR family transcriptional regulator [Chelatococcus sp. GCM10030263]|uniref:TetR/AcrR family transcriptional regulator n=1 Tax=Chelatococcus sp. GCM10030263 TaxID=3273387 RepID=UPI0036185BD7
MESLVLAAKSEERMQDAAKRREIMEGARQVFRARGFDGASMGDIAKAAGVSKGTLYVYFDSKESLFRALINLDRRDAAERLFDLDEEEPDVRGVLGRLGRSFVSMMLQPDHIALLRMVIGAAEKFPALGRAFFEAGPCFGVSRLSAYLARQTAAGRLKIDDPDLAAAQFLSLVQGVLTKGPLFGVSEPPTARTIETTVDSAVEVFFAAYGPRA